MSDRNESTMASPLSAAHHFERVAIVFAGGPAPAANAVISTAATAFLRHDVDVVGVLHGYSHLVDYSPENPLLEGRDYVMLNHRMLGRTRNSRASSSAPPAPIRAKTFRTRRISTTQLASSRCAPCTKRSARSASTG
jgi:hypothetical protein